MYNKLLELNDKIDELEEKRLKLVVKALEKEIGKREYNGKGLEWLSVDAFDANVSIGFTYIQIYFGNYFAEIRYLPNYSEANDYVDIKIFEKGLYKVFNLFESELEITENFASDIIGRISEGINHLKDNKIWKD